MSLPAGMGTWPQALNTWGQVAGAVDVGGATHAALWTAGVTEDLGTLVGASYNSGADYVNEAGWVTGWSDWGGSGAYHAFAWIPPTDKWSWPPPPPVPPNMRGMRDLGTIGNGDSSWVWDMNDRGQFVGESNTAGNPNAWIPVLWEFLPDGNVVRSQINTGVWSIGYWTWPPIAINNLGQGVAWGHNAAGGGTRVLLWSSLTSGNAPQDLPAPLVPDCYISYSTGPVGGSSPFWPVLSINDRGQVLAEFYAGCSPYGPLHDAYSISFLWEPTAGAWTMIPASGIWNHGNALNNAGQVVGTSVKEFSQAGWVWSAKTGLHELPPASPFSVSTAWAINNVGQVVGDSGDYSGAVTTLWRQDTDWIGDLIDDAPQSFSTRFDDCDYNPGTCPYGYSPTDDGSTWGRILATNLNRYAVVDVPPGLYPPGCAPGGVPACDDGVKILNFGGGVSPGVTFEACGDLWDPITGHGGAIVTCHSLRLAVGAGEWTIEVPNAPVVVPAGAAVSLEEVAPGVLTVSSDAESVATVTVGGTPLAPGETMVLTPNAPAAVDITGPESGAVYAVGTPVAFAAMFTDDVGDAHTAEWTIGGLPFPGTVTEADGSGTVTDMFAFTAAGVYSVTLTVTDSGGASGSANTVGDLPAFVVVYDPSAGFVTGGGWIPSPPGAFAGDPGATGKASFGFVAKYQKGRTLPTGETEFQFQAGDLNFHSVSYDWLVCSGPKCQFKGDGTVNGVGGYSFLLTAIDGDLPGGGGQDKLRMKIWVTMTGQIVYDNQMGDDEFADPTTVIGGGSIVIHKG